METSKVNRRFVIGKNLEENSCTEKFTSDELGINGDNDFLITKSINKIRKQGKHRSAKCNISFRKYQR